MASFKELNEYHERLKINYDITQFGFGMRGLKEKVQDQLKVRPCRSMNVLVSFKVFLTMGIQN